MDQHRRWPRDAVVVGAHRGVVSAGGKHHQHIAAASWRQGQILEQHVARFAVLTSHGDGFAGLGRGAIGQHRRVLGLVGDRPGVVAHAAVHREVGAEAGDVLAAAQLVEGDPGAGHQGTPRFTEQAGQLQPPLLTGRHHRLSHAAHPLTDARRIVAGGVANAQATAHVEINHRVPQGAGQGQGIGHHASQVAVGLELENLGADMGVQPGELGPRAGRQVLQHRLELVGIKAKLAVEVAGADVLMGVALNARRKTQHQLHGSPQVRG